MSLKRNATPIETEAAILANMQGWNRRNPDHHITEEEWRGKQTEAEAQGHKTEICSLCDTVFLAFHHFTTCELEGCPLIDGVSLLDRLKNILEG